MKIMRKMDNEEIATWRYLMGEISFREFIRETYK